MMGSWWIAAFLELTHIVSEVGVASYHRISEIIQDCIYFQVEWPKPDDNNVVNMDW